MTTTASMDLAVRAMAVLASLAVAVAAASLPASFVTVRADAEASMTTQDPAERQDPGPPGQETGSESSSDDDLDERLDDLDEVDGLMAVLHHASQTFVPSSNLTTWPVHEPRSPQHPHPEDTLRPPIAA